MAPTDEDLVMRCAAGDQESFLMLHDRFAPRVFGLLIKIIGQRTEAEDVLQEVMWEAWTRSDRYNRSLGSVAAWLHDRSLARHRRCTPTSRPEIFDGYSSR